MDGQKNSIVTDEEACPPEAIRALEVLIEGVRRFLRRKAEAEKAQVGV
jgi:hypothetical protein